MGEWWHNRRVWWDEFKFKHPWWACSLQYGVLFLVVVLVGHVISSMANIVYFRYPFDDFGYPFNFSYPLNETFRHPFNVTTNLTINNATTMYADNARSILCTLVESEAAIVAIVVSLTLIAIQFTASEYSPRVIDISLRNPDMWILLIIYGMSIFYGLVLIKQVPHDYMIPFEDLSSAFWLGVFSYVALVPYIRNISNLLKPENIIKHLASDITNDEISNKKKGPIQAIEDIIRRSIMNHDFETIRVGLTVLTDRVIKINEEPCGKPQGIINHITTLLPKVTLWQATGNSQVNLNNKEVISKPFCDSLERIIRLAVREMDEEPIIAVITNLEKCGKATAKERLENAIWNVAFSLGEVGKAAVEKGKELENATLQVVLSLEAVGRDAAREKIENATSRVKSSLEEIEKAATEKGEEPENVTRQVKSSLDEIEKVVAEKVLEDAKK